MKMTPASKLDDFKGKRQWFVVNAENQVVGKLATKIASVLRGKNKANFSEHVDCGDYIVVINAEKVKFTGSKMADKPYRRHSGYLGNLKEETAEKIIEKQPKRILEEAVWGMLPRNKLRKHFMSKLFIYKGVEHKHDGQKPVVMEM